VHVAATLEVTVRVSCLVFVSILACSAPGSGSRGDGGSGGRFDAGSRPLTDGQAMFPDRGPFVPWDAGDPEAGCMATTPVEATIVGDPPDLLIVMDISGSMCSPIFAFPPTMETKMQIMKMALTGLTTRMDARINFGLMTYPGDGECGAGNIRNDIAVRNAGPINTTIGAIPHDLFTCALANPGATPTHLSIDAAREYYRTIPVNPIGRYALLATDGLPNCGPPLPDGGTEETVDETVAAITALSADGIRTFVIGFGADFTGDPGALMRMATAGGTGMPYAAMSAADLDAALDAIAAEVIVPSCTVELDGPVRDPALFRVSFDGGAPIPRNPGRTSGWDYDAATNTITFYGADCARVERGEVTNIDVDFGCPGPLI
jgi:hypothetical protein